MSLWFHISRGYISQAATAIAMPQRVCRVSTFSHPANHPIDFLKSSLFWDFFINSIRVRVRVAVRG